MSVIDGTWEMVRAELEGEAAPELVVEQTEMELRDGAYVVRFAGRVTDRGAFEFGGDDGARTLLLRGVEGPNAGRTIPCLYQRVGDRLRLCCGLDGVLPTGFSTAPGQRRYLATYRLRSDAAG